MNIILSLIARQHKFLSNHYELTSAGRSLKKYKNIFKGQRCFIVANGPSLTVEDLEILYQNNEITFGMNRIFKIFEKTSWRPTFYVCEDELIFNECEADINNVDAEAKFVPIELKWYHGINVKKAKYFHINYDRRKDYKYSFSTNISHQVDCRGTVTFTCMQIAAYMGFEKIYLLGVDHNYQRTIDVNGKIVEDSNVKDYFCEGYDSDIKNQVIHDMGNNTRAYLDAKKYCDTTESVKIINATRGGKLEIFERIKFEELFNGGY